MNALYKTRYDKFIDAIKSLGDRSFECYTERHHIIPRCLKGSDSRANLIKLTPREHFLAHWLLWKAYPNYLPLASAFLQMNNKNPKLRYKEFQGRITSRTYQKLRTETYDNLSKLHTDKVKLTDKDGNKLTLTKAEYAAQDTLVFHTKGKILVFDKISNKQVYIKTTEYYKNKEQYITRLSNLAPDHISQILYQFLDTDTNSKIKLSKKEARNLNKAAGYKKYKQIINHRVSCIDSTGTLITLPLSKYHANRAKLTHTAQNRLSVYDINEQITKSISIEEYNLDKNRYQTSTKGKVLAKDSTGNTVLVTREEFQNKKYVGITSGLRTVFDRERQTYVQITEDVFLQNRTKYAGPCYNKINVIDKFSGERKQIEKSDFDKTKYSPLGTTKFLFRCKNKLTGKEKNVNIYEWHLVSGQYDILEHDKFSRALREK